MSTLVSVPEYKLAVNDTDENTAHLQRIDLLLRWASAAVRRFADRDFGAEPVTEERSYPYTGDSIVEIDDLAAATSVTIDGLSLTSAEYQLGPQATIDDVYYFIQVPESRHRSSEMGFLRNADVLGFSQFAYVTIDGTWGWPDVPEDVKQAVVWTTADLLSDPSGYNSESLAEYSYSRGSGGGNAVLRGADAIPARAQRLLEPFRRVSL